MCNISLEHYARIDHDAARDFFDVASRDIRDDSKETPLRNLFCTRLPLMFPSVPWWIDEHARKAETSETFRIESSEHNGFVDTLIGRTAVEYEKNLEKSALFNHGLHQVEDYCAGLLNNGIDADDIIGILSDTVRWYAYRVIPLRDRASFEGGIWGRDDIQLEQIDHLDMTDYSNDNLNHFEVFINRYYGRLGSRDLTPKALAHDFGLSSMASSSYRDGITELVGRAVEEKPGYASLIKNLWQGFVERATGGDCGFDENYPHELYLVTLAKLIAANLIEGNATYRSDAQISAILNGRYFHEMGIENLVEYDYFGWINEGAYLNDLVPYAQMMQHDLAAYDFRNVATTDLFGELIAQMAGTDRRILLGQAPTPRWIAQAMVASMLGKLGDERPHLLDMCCGSGVFIVEVLSQLIERMGAPSLLDQNQMDYLLESVTGFDVDPLAVLLAKVNWLFVMRGYLLCYEGRLFIPIHHADSLFTTTPVSEHGGDDGRFIDIRLYDRTVSIPSFLLNVEYRALYDELIANADVYADSIANGVYEPERSDASKRVDEICLQYGMLLDSDDRECVSSAFGEMVKALADLRRRDRNGIWPFVLNNSFKPAFVEGRFNGIVSNPPWLALSRLHDNPYKNSLVELAGRYGIMPQGSAFLHVEIATVFLIASVFRYLDDGGFVACVMPHSILNGRHGEPFRHGDYLDANTPVNLRLTEIWELPSSTFNNRAVVLFADKTQTDGPASEVSGILFLNREERFDATFKLLTAGNITAFSANETEVLKAVQVLSFDQGYDGMPRTAVVFDARRQPNGKWTLSSIPRNGSPLSFAVKDGKKCKDFDAGTVSNIDDSLVYDMVTSTLLMPFVEVTSTLKAFLVVKRHPSGEVTQLTNRELELLGRGNLLLASKVLSCKDNGVDFYSNSHAHSYLGYIDYWSKLTKTLDDTAPYRVIYPASGKNLAATILRCDNISSPHKLAIDQTLYWRSASSEDEAYYYVGMLNSSVINEAIKDFQAQGLFGERHIHELPLAFIEEFDSSDERHIAVSDAARAVFACVAQTCAIDDSIAKLVDPSRGGTLPSRRRRFQDFLKTTPEFEALNKACSALI